MFDGSNYFVVDQLSPALTGLRSTFTLTKLFKDLWHKSPLNLSLKDTS